MNEERMNLLSLAAIAEDSQQRMDNSFEEEIHELSNELEKDYPERVIRAIRNEIDSLRKFQTRCWVEWGNLKDVHTRLSK